MKYFICVLFLISIFVLSSCSNEASINQLKQENTHLRLENKQLLEKNDALQKSNDDSKSMQEKMDVLNREINILKEEEKQSVKVIKNYQTAFAQIQQSSNILEHVFGIFSPEQVKIGSQIAGLTVKEVKTEPTNFAKGYLVDFTGEFEVKGSIIHNDLGGSRYSFIVDKDLQRVPHTLGELEWNMVKFDILHDQELEDRLGDVLKNLPMNGRLEVVAVFKNYRYHNVPHTDVPNTAEFVRIVSQEK